MGDWSSLNACTFVRSLMNTTGSQKHIQDHNLLVRDPGCGQHTKGSTKLTCSLTRRSSATHQAVCLLYVLFLWMLWMEQLIVFHLSHHFYFRNVWQQAKMSYNCMIRWVLILSRERIGEVELIICSIARMAGRQHSKKHSQNTVIT